MESVVEAEAVEGPVELDDAAAEAPTPSAEPVELPPSTDESRAFRLRSKESVPRGIRRIARGRIDRALEELAGRTDHDPAEAVHEARKDLKKLRAVLRLTRDGIGNDIYRPENRRYRDAGRHLSSARDAQVMVDTLDSICERYDDELPADGLAELRQMLDFRRRSLETAGQSGNDARVEAARTIVAGRDRVEDWPLRDDWSTIGGGLKRAYARGRSCFEVASEEPSIPNLHEWRKRVKDLWYHLLILQRAWPGVMEPMADQAHDLSDHLGDDHDLAVLRDAAADRPEAFRSPGDRHKLEELIERRRGELQRDAVSLGRRLYAEKPGAFADRLEAYWRAWRVDSGRS
jgi:CHAD domain-containing protein